MRKTGRIFLVLLKNLVSFTVLILVSVAMLDQVDQVAQAAQVDQAARSPVFQRVKPDIYSVAYLA